MVALAACLGGIVLTPLLYWLLAASAPTPGQVLAISIAQTCLVATQAGSFFLSLLSMLHKDKGDKTFGLNEGCHVAGMTMSLTLLVFAVLVGGRYFLCTGNV